METMPRTSRNSLTNSAMLTVGMAASALAIIGFARQGGERSLAMTPTHATQPVGVAKPMAYVQCPPAWLKGPCRTTFVNQGAAVQRPVGSIPVTFNTRQCKRDVQVHAGAVTTPSMVITGNNIELTESIAAYTNDKLGQMLKKYKDFVKSSEVHFTVNKNPSQKEMAHKVEVTVYVKDSKVMRGSVSSVSEYSSIDLVTDLINRKMRKYKERKNGKRTNSGVKTFYRDDISDSSDAGEMLPIGEDDVQGEFEPVPNDYKPMEDVSLVRKKKFPMPPISIEDATLCLDYLDHDFYVFRNADTKEINVVYRRAEGGVGLIEPEAQG
uniref:Sigma 54 modulation/S30EA ribosomal protein C-terminal domain-containing protein n=1 Tax=Lotharella globosa TaxID=91324 RepID=A0A6V3PVS7_9EUKA|mmetsp:Transcript_21538/g.43241  ORF Transcript_21538/g.43241 Transcript_21538/m.43241 type:complete len:324 (-) Transcript_21538:521-1492(-)